MRTVVIVLALAAGVGLNLGAQNVPRFDVTSIKRCRPNDDVDRGNTGVASPGQLKLDCERVKALIARAYIRFRDGRQSGPGAMVNTPIEGGPGWINDEMYRVAAKPERPASFLMMQGPMLQALLEDRFRLKVHYEKREVPAYNLVVAKGGAKLQPFPEGSCAPYEVDPAQPLGPPVLPAGAARACKGIGVRSQGPNWIVDVEGITLDAFAKTILSIAVNRQPVFDRTNLQGKFNIHFAYAVETGTVDDRPIDLGSVQAPPLFDVLQEQLGLRLQPTKGPGEFLMIDHIEHPSED